MDLLARACELKPELVHFATNGRFHRELSEVLERFFPDGPAQDEAHAVLAVDYFVLQHRLAGGDTVVDRFVADHPALDARDRELLLGWKDVVEGIFEVRSIEGAAAILFNLIDELTYRAYSNLGSESFDPLEPGMFLVGRLVALGAEGWMISGTPAVYTADTRDSLVPIAAESAMRNPAAVFRNPIRLTQAWELQTLHRNCFVDFFGTDLVVVPAAEVTEQVRDYLAFQRERLAGDDDRPPVEIPFPASLLSSGSVALIFDEVDGLGYYADFELLEAAFEDPALVAKQTYREVVSSYLRGDAVSPVPIRRLARRDPARASELFATLLGRRDFSWKRDGEELLRKQKPAYFDSPRMPTVTPVTDVLAEHLRTPAA